MLKLGKMHVCLCLFLFVCIEISQVFAVCKPELNIDSEKKEPSMFLSECNFETSLDCSNIQSVLFERWSDVNQTFDVALTIFRSNPTPEYGILIDGYTLERRVTHLEEARNFLIEIDPTSIKDNGTWRCAVIDNNGDRYLSDNQIFQITNDGLSSISVDRVESGVFVLSEPYTYWCSSPEVSPRNVNFTWIIGNRNYKNGFDNSEPNGYVWTVNKTIQIIANATSEKEIRCKIEKTTGLEWFSEQVWAIPNNVAKPSIVEYVLENKVDRFIECVVSGDNPSITWSSDNNAWDSNLFVESIDNITGLFAYNQTSALRTTLTLREIDACQYIEQLSGQLTCMASGFGPPASRSLMIDLSTCGGIGAGCIAGITITVVAVAVALFFLILRCCCPDQFFGIFCCCKDCCHDEKFQCCCCICCDNC